MKLSALQRQVLARVAVSTLKQSWYRAASSGERVTLASLYRAGLIERQAHRGTEGEASAAHEYKLTNSVLTELREMLTDPSP